MQATVQTNMRREIDEIPEAAARLLDRLAKDFAATGAALRAEDSEFVVTVACGLSDYVPEIVHRAEGEIARRFDSRVTPLNLRYRAQLWSRRCLAEAATRVIAASIALTNKPPLAEPAKAMSMLSTKVGLYLKTTHISWC